MSFGKFPKTYAFDMGWKHPKFKLLERICDEPQRACADCPPGVPGIRPGALPNIGQDDGQWRERVSRPNWAPDNQGGA
jgi:hypothetical protein